MPTAPIGHQRFGSGAVGWREPPAPGVATPQRRQALLAPGQRLAKAARSSGNESMPGLW